ncbi:MAG: twin-arginine translocase subunit TatC [Armatimonadetes bacterium]|nr:twin-arginine translocase subunit TatC [Armatimonadota bacterium]
MTLVGHLDELRGRLLWALGSWAVAATICYYYTPHLLAVARPHLIGKAELIFTAPAAAFFAYLQVAMVAGFFLACPIIIYQVVMFVLPGLEPHERRYLFQLMPVGVILFVVGVTFGYYVVLPVTMKFFLSFSTEDLRGMIDIKSLVGWVLGILAICGIIFQLPLVLFFGALIGFVRSEFLRKQRRMAIFLAFLISAIATPTPDAFTASVVAVPILLLFEGSLVLIRLIGK